MRLGHIALLCFCLFVGGAIGFLAGRSGEPAKSGTEEAPAPEVTAGGGIPRPKRPVTEDATLADVLAGIPIPDVETGDGEITGYVKLQNGEPLEGVLIRATRPRKHGSGSAWDQPPEDRDLEEVVIDLVLDHHHEKATRVETRTGPDGRFRLAGLLDARHTVRAWLPGYQIYARDSWQAWPGASIDFTANPIARLTVTVFDPNGGEAVEARLDAKIDTRGSRMHMWSKTAREWTLPPGKYSVTALANSGEWKSDPVDVELTGPGDRRAITLRLASRPGIRGEIVHPEGEVESGYVTVYCMGSPANDEPTVRDLRARGQKTDLWARQSRSFVFADLKPGEYLIALVKDRRILDSARVTVTNSMVVKDLTVPPPDPEEHVVVTVLGPDGKPVEGARISTGMTHENGRSSGGGQPTPLGRGRYRVRHHQNEDYEGIEGVTYFLVVTAPKLGDKEVVYDRETTRELTVRFEEPATLDVRVVGAPEGWLGGRLTVGLRTLEERHSGSSTRHNPPKEGVVTCEPVTPGEYEVILWLRMGEHDSARIATRKMTLRGGRQETTLSMPKLYSVTLIVPENIRRVRISRRDRNHGFWGFRVPVKDGRAVVSDLPAGTYEAHASGSHRGGPVIFKLPGPAEVPFEPAVMNAVEVRVKDPSKLLGQLGFRDGDIIIGANGKLFENERQLGALFLGSPDKKPVPLTIIRGGSRIELKVELFKMMEASEKGDLGGDIDVVPRPE